MVRSVSRTEPEWDDEQRGWVQALMLVQADRCGKCGGDLVETTAADADDDYEVEPLRCHRCHAIAAWAAADADSGRQFPQAVHLVTYRRSKGGAGTS